MLIAEKYKPKNLKGYYGNNKNKDSVVRHLINGTRNVFLLYGPPGIGKTSLVYAIAGEHDYDVVEVNASDVRNEKDIKQYLDPMPYTIEGNRKVILFDECDNLSASGKRGVTEFLKETQCIVFLTANVYQAVGDGIKNKALCLKFKKPMASTIAKFLKDINKEEGFGIEVEIIKEMAVRADSFRDAINILQAYLPSRAILPFKSVKAPDNMFAIVAEIFKGNTTQYWDVKPDELLLWTTQNIDDNLSEYPLFRGVYMRELMRLEALMKEGERISDYHYWKYIYDAMSHMHVSNNPKIAFPFKISFYSKTKGIRKEIAEKKLLLKSHGISHPEEWLDIAEYVIEKKEVIKTKKKKEIQKDILTPSNSVLDFL